jgi:hypothetical protein
MALIGEGGMLKRLNPVAMLTAIAAKRGCVQRGVVPPTKLTPLREADEWDEALDWCQERFEETARGFRAWPAAAERQALFEFASDFDGVDFALRFA